MVAPGTALPSLSGSGKASDLVAEMKGTARAAAAAARGAADRGAAPAARALSAAGASGVRSDKEMASEKMVARRDFRGKAILKAFKFIGCLLEGLGWVGGFLRGPKAWRRELGQRYVKLYLRKAESG